MSRSDPACSKQERPTNYTDSIGPGVFALTAPAASSRKHRVGELSMQFILFSIPRWVSMRFSERAPPLDRPEGGQNLLRYMTPNKTLLLTALCLFIFVRDSLALGQAQYVETVSRQNSFPIVQGNAAASLYVDSDDFAGIVRAANDLQADVVRVTGVTPAILHEESGLGKNVIIVGRIGKSRLIDRLIRDGKIDAAQLTGKWESFLIQVVAEPLPGVASALVIAGSDKRGTIYGIYDLSEQMGVSPWYWWADVTPEHKPALYVRAGKYQQGEPSVTYRGIFFNDEKPDLDLWVRSRFGEHAVPGGTAANFNSVFYSKVFEVILRMKGNYLWPAMWNNAFAEDDPDTPRIADEYGIVMGTSHQEPMMRAQKEWDWHLRAANGNWNYATQSAILDDFWRQGIRQRKDFENIYTMGLRGENDSAMVRTAAEGVALTEKIVTAQRKMLAEEVNPDATKVPQLWALYKEVQQYYEGGLRVPDDVTLLWAEDNWGNLRRVPTLEERKRSGGAGIYYHFDYHGGPRSYQWLNTSPVNKIWEQMSLAKQYGADRIWIVNVNPQGEKNFPSRRTRSTNRALKILACIQALAESSSLLGTWPASSRLLSRLNTSSICHRPR